MSKIVILDGYTTNPGDLSWEAFEKFGPVTVYDRTPASEIFSRVGDADLVLTNKTPFPRETLALLPSVRYLGAMSTGYNVIDAAAAKDLGITVTYVPEYATYATAQMTVALMLELANQAGRHNRIVHEGGWTKSVDFCFTAGPLTELWNKTLGLVGYGKIAKRTALTARALGMRVLANSRSIENALAVPDLSGTKNMAGTPDEDGVVPASFDTVLRESDVISFHCPLTPETQGLINRDTISRMKNGVLLVNTSRGPVFVEKDVAEALKSGKIAGCAVDVLSAEPAQEDNPLLTAPNCIITPHIAWAPKETRQRLLDTVYANLKNYLDGKPCNAVP